MKNRNVICSKLLKYNRIQRNSENKIKCKSYCYYYYFFITFLKRQELIMQLSVI